jgi:hypothetical protein
MSFSFANIAILRRELEWLVSNYSVGVGPHFTELEELEILDDGRLTCYIRGVDDYYYVSDRVTRDHSPSRPSWIDHLCYKNETGEVILFKEHIANRNFET